jgi:3-phytase/alkaline phosphatase D
VCLAVLASAALGIAPGLAQEQPPLRFLGEYDIAVKSLEVDGTTVGGLSGLTYDPRRGVFYVISDDRGDFGPARFYTVHFDIGLDGIRDVHFLGATVLDSDAATPGIQPYAPNDSDTEDILLLPDDTLLISSERDRNSVPWLRRFALDGSLLDEWGLPDLFVPASTPDAQGRPTPSRGVRSNYGFEGTAYAPDEAAVYVMNEEALVQDGPIATPTTGTLNRLLRYALASGQATPGRQAAYLTEPIFARPPADGAADNGVSSMIWSRGVLPQFDLLVMERSFVTNAGNNVALFGVTLAGADDVSSRPALPIPFTGRGVTRTPLANMTDFGIKPDNLEGLALGPRLPDGRTSLLIVADDNFGDTQIGQILLFSIGEPRGK